MAKAEWNGATLAQSETFEVVEGNVYFPADALQAEFFRPSSHTSHCGWKGDARYYDIVVNGDTNKNAAWYYPAPFEKAAKIKDYVAFWKGVVVTR